MNPVLNQCLIVSGYLSHLVHGSLMERLDKLNGLGPLPLRWFLTHQEKNHGPPQAAHIATSGLLQPWPGVTDSPMWFHSRCHIYTPCIACQRCPQEIMFGELYKFFLMNMNFYHYPFIHFIFFPTK